MTTPQITALPTPPSRNDPSNFSTRADSFLGALPAFTTETNNLATYLNNLTVEFIADNLSATSSTGFSLDTSVKTLTIDTNKSFSAGMLIKITDTTSSTKYLICTVTSYDKITGILIASVNSIEGVGTVATSNVSLSAPVQSSVSTGDVVLTGRSLSAPAWLPANGGIYSQSSYAALYAELGLLRNGVARGGAELVAVGANNIQAQYSAPNPGMPTYPIFAVTSGFRAYGKTTGASTHKLARSANGSTWSVASLPATTADSPYVGFAAIGTTIIGVPPSGDAWVARSTDDGATWVTAAVIPSGSQAPFVLGGLFVVLTSTTTYYTSADGISWTSRTAPAVLYQRGIFDGTCFAVSGSAPITTVYTSTDAITWTARTVPSIYLNFVRSVGSVLLLFPYFNASGSAAYLRSTDGGATWSSHTTTSGPGYEYVGSAETLNGVLYAESNINGSQEYGSIYTTADGLLWSVESVGAPGTGYSYLSKLSDELVYRVEVSPYPKYVRQGGAWIYAGASSQDRYLQGQLEVEYGGVVIRPASTASSSVWRKSVYTYNSATQFAVPQLAAPTGVTAYIKA